VNFGAGVRAKEKRGFGIAGFIAGVRGKVRVSLNPEPWPAAPSRAKRPTAAGPGGAVWMAAADKTAANGTQRETSNSMKTQAKRNA